MSGFTFPDVSEWNANVDIAEILKLTGGVLAIRAGFGVGRKDLVFDRFREEAHDAGVKALLIYHFYVGTDSPSWGHRGGGVEENVNAFFDYTGGHLRPNEVPVGDFEFESGRVGYLTAARYLNQVAELSVNPPMTYTNQAYGEANGYRFLHDRFPLWVASYGSLDGGPAPAPTLPYVAWQFTDGYHGIRTPWPADPTPVAIDTNTVPDLTPEQFVGKIAPASGGPLRIIRETAVPTQPAKVGDTGDHVAELQAVLSEFLGYPVAEDGYFGSRTALAVRDFQGATGRPSTGNYMGDDAIVLYRRMGGR